MQPDWTTRWNTHDRSKPLTLPSTVFGIPDHLLRTYAISGVVTAMTGLGAAALLMSSRMLTRLSLVRRTAAGKTDEFLRMRTLGQEMLLGPRATPRAVPRDQCAAYLKLGRPLASGERERTSVVSFWVNSPRASSPLSKDHYGYRMDFADSASLERLADQGAEVVLSPRRLEDVFGPLKPKDAPSKGKK